MDKPIIESSDTL